MKREPRDAQERFLRDLALELKNSADPTGLIKTLRLKLIAISNERGQQKHKNVAILERIINNSDCLQQYKSYDTRCYLSSILVQQLDRLDLNVKP